MNSGLSYDQFYKVLLKLREDFHAMGRFDDSNVKLDEIVKLLCLAYSRATKGETFTLLDLRSVAQRKFGDTTKTASALRSMFEDVATESLYLSNDGTSVFGANPQLNIQETDDAFAEEIISELSKIDFLSLVTNKNDDDFDVINECFGHFVRENFRNNKEDAQYMTPLEIARPYIDTVYMEMDRDGYFDNIDSLDFRVMDPTCGVGTLLLEAARKYIDVVNQSHSNNKEKLTQRFLESGIVGQDKVERMVRLSKINSTLFGASAENIMHGNSIVGTSGLDDYSGKIDLIFTNPPFGADFSITELPERLRKAVSEDGLTGSKLSSEVLMLYRSLDLLKEGGYLAIVLPDSVVSSKGNNARIRQGLLERCDVQSVVELPAVAFAQAGTRTKTVIILVRKKAPSGDSIVMCTCEDVGFVVKERSGVPVKTKTTTNDMEKYSELYPETRDETTVEVICEKPSITTITNEQIIGGQLTPSFYSAERLLTYQSLTECQNPDFEFKPLKDIVSFETKKRKKHAVSENTKHISVLHVRGDSTIDFEEVERFEPISDGRLCKEGDVIFSKINPSIPRISVVPKKDYQTVCSMEFEILKPIDNAVGPNTLCLMLKSPVVRSQIKNLTSGTSSSHSRIKSEQLEEILIPYPVSEFSRESFSNLEASTTEVFRRKYQCDEMLKKNLDFFETIH